MTTLFDFTCEALEGAQVPLREYAGKVVLVVNTASQCGFTPQFAGLEELYQHFQARGVVVFGFPCNQFGAQEPGNKETIGAFCQRNYGVTFPMFAKIEVNGENAHPLYDFLTSEARGFLGTKRIKWNFTKFLVGRDGYVVKRFAPTVKPAALYPAIERILA